MSSDDHPPKSRSAVELAVQRILEQEGEAGVLARLRGAQPADPGIEDLGYAQIDHDREPRRGFPEVIYGPGKTKDQLIEIFDRLQRRHDNVLATRVEHATGLALATRYSDVQFDPASGLVSLWRERGRRGRGKIVVVSAGTSDQHVAYEAVTCAQVMGNEVEQLCDVGVAGIQRLFNVLPQLRAAEIIICVAGMEAALCSVVAGLVDSPVIAVPTSVGYGASFAGVTALLSCLTACASGVVTVNIDNGFGAAYAASLMNRA